ncbi:clustered mitochondria protein homolog isoform X2 [Macrosteles quadrilineatus]|uniref:clustered mitochondria protein homolog isoform X2 n=1 Tax=Macrosteles quadrilineatus TaxID=74068 RepID=UPI0023E31833|nr:clustered mitochondria protein homolog isoform X2 [Macrosteles quadrilineatus]
MALESSVENGVSDGGSDSGIDIGLTKANIKKEKESTKEGGGTPITNGVTEVNGNCNGTEEVEKGETEANEKGGDKKDEAEVVFIQDMGFTVKIVSPGTEAFDIQVSSMELVQEIHQLLMDREDTCHRTCFSLQLDGNTLDNFAELKNIEGLKEGSIIKVVEEPYTMREARIHVRHVRDLLKSLDPADAYNGVDCSSLSFLNIITQEKKKSRAESVDCTPPDYIMPGCRERPLLPLQPFAKEQKGPQCIKVLTTSGWNPPPGYRKMHGDLMYLYVVTLEDKHYHITACTRGFFLNQCTEEEFNAKPAVPSHLCHSLIELLSQLSPAFKRNFAILQKKRTQRHPFERVATPYQVYAWASPLTEHTVDAIRAEDTFSSKLGYEEHIPGQTRDWNEELQTTRELPRKNLPERLLRERAIFKVHSDFVAGATRGAMAVIDGNVMAINPGEESKMQMFIWNNIFFSLGFDVRDHYKELGGDAAAFVAPRNDLQGVRVYSAVDLTGLYTLGTVVIDYRGYRVTAQSIIPGILEREQEQSVVYGSIDFGKTVLSHPKYMELLSKAAQQLKILPHKVVNDKAEEVELCSSVECKGIIGNDGRHYILDLLRTFPPDVNFLKLPGEELSREVTALGFPIEHKHKLCCLRQELIDSFVESRYMMFIKYAAFHLQQLGAKKQREREARSQEKELESKEKDKKIKAIDNKLATRAEVEKVAEENPMEADEAKKIVESITDSITSGEKQELEESTKEIVKKAALAVGSLKETEFDIRFNPDVFSPGVKHTDPDGSSLKKERQLVKDAADFLVTAQIPTFIRDCLDHSGAPMDGVTLSEGMHTRGINIRYLGKIANMLSKVNQLEYLHNIAVAELITRSAKHVFTTYMQSTELMCLSAAISHFLNCFLSSCQMPHPVQAADELQSKTSKRRNKRKGRMNHLLSSDSNEWANLTPKSLFQQIRGELKAYYDWDLPTDTMDTTLEHFSLQKISLLRSFCLKTGIQILLREYSFDAKNRLTFFEEDIINIFPVVKHINPRASDAFNFYTTGQSKIQQGYLKEGYELISEALNLLNNVYGAMHPEIAQCLRMLARLNYIMGDHAEAMAYQQKAVLMSERVNGIDHPYTITEYTHLALYCFANSQISTALKLLYRARYLALLVCGENHPEIALLDSNISLILHAVGEYELSLRFLEKALALNIKFYGTKSLKVAVSYHLVARTQSCMGDFRSALNNEKETYAIYKQQLGEDHEKTKESSDCLRHLTHQAVVLQKKMNEIYTGKPGVGLPPIQIQPPSMGSVLDMLNVINGILFVQISQQDIENFKAEIEKRQAKEEEDKEKENSPVNDTLPSITASQVLPES